jgi:hypothetical protein
VDNCDLVSEVTATAGQDFIVYVLACNGNATDGIGGMEFGIEYDDTPGVGIDVNGYADCGILHYTSFTPAWPDSGSGIMVAWNGSQNCQLTPTPAAPRAAGVALDITYYSPDQLRIVEFPGTYGSARVADCGARADTLSGFTPSRLGTAGFNLPGYNSCCQPFPALCTVPRIVTTSPDRTTRPLPYQVQVRDILGNPLPNLQVEILPAITTNLCVCPTMPMPYTAFTDPSGVATFDIRAGGCMDNARLGGSVSAVRAKGTTLGIVSINSADPVDAQMRLPTDPGYSPKTPCQSDLTDVMFLAVSWALHTYDACLDVALPYRTIDTADSLELIRLMGPGGTCP